MLPPSETASCIWAQFALLCLLSQWQNIITKTCWAKLFVLVECGRSLRSNTDQAGLSEYLGIFREHWSCPGLYLSIIMKIEVQHPVEEKKLRVGALWKDHRSKPRLTKEVLLSKSGNDQPSKELSRTIPTSFPQVFILVPSKLIHAPQTFSGNVITLMGPRWKPVVQRHWTTKWEYRTEVLQNYVLFPNTLVCNFSFAASLYSTYAGNS